MRILQFSPLFILICSIGCNRQSRTISELDHPTKCDCDFSADASSPSSEPTYKMVKGALLGTRFKSLDELRTVIQIKYFNNTASSDSSIEGNLVRISHCSNGLEVINVLTSGITQGDLWNARYANIWKRSLSRLKLIIRSPWVVANRRDLQRIYTLSRWRPEWFGEGDVAFFDLAKAMKENINTDDLAFRNTRDSTEKGYLNSFNHITAQAFVTSCFSQKMADFVADAHERYSHPELITGNFTKVELTDLKEGPVDNYVDLINNEWGQELGKQLKEKYIISRETIWTPELLANYLNDMQSYYSWAFNIGFRPFRSDDEIIIKFSSKMRSVMRDKYG